MSDAQDPTRISAGSAAPGAFFTGLVLGGLLTYFFDPERGIRRRHLARDRAAALIRRDWHKLEQLARTYRGELRGGIERLKQRASHVERPVVNDATLAHRVESELFRDSSFGRGMLNINAQFGIVVLRGQLPRPELIQKVEEITRKIEGVRGVINLTHLPNTPARHI